MRKPLIAGNWKMHGLHGQVSTLANGIKQGAKEFSAEQIEVLVLPPFVYLQQVRDLLTGTAIAWGAQNLYLGTQGAFTGEISANMLVDLGCQYVLVGHSERRTLFKENDQLIAEKFKSALAAGLKPILCLGETKAEREQGQTEQIIHSQLAAVIDEAGIEAFAQAVIAYEPVWAIGTGLTATAQEAQTIHLFIRNLLMKNNVDIARTIRILYGGSMKPDNAAALLSMPDIDGGLIGGASLDADSFLAICRAALKEQPDVALRKMG